MKKLLIFAFLILSFGASGLAQNSSEFWFAAPDIDGSHADRPIYLHLTAHGTPAIVDVYIGGALFGSYPLAANATQRIDLTADILNVENQFLTTPLAPITNARLDQSIVQNNSIHIISHDAANAPVKISAY